MTPPAVDPSHYDKSVVAWIVVWPDKPGRQGRIVNKGEPWWQLAVVRMQQGATVTEIRKPRLASTVGASRDG
jgi:hypothetical protein